MRLHDEQLRQGNQGWSQGRHHAIGGEDRRVQGRRGQDRGGDYKRPRAWKLHLDAEGHIQGGVSSQFLVLSSESRVTQNSVLRTGKGRRFFCFSRSCSRCFLCSSSMSRIDGGGGAKVISSR